MNVLDALSATAAANTLPDLADKRQLLSGQISSPGSAASRRRWPRSRRPSTSRRSRPTPDLILLLPGASFAEPPPEHVVSALLAARERGATLAAHCLGVFHLAATGLLDQL